MELESGKINRYVAIGYLVFAFANLGILTILINTTGWHGIYIAFQEFTTILKILLIQSGLLLVNILLAFGSWRVHFLTSNHRKLLIASAVIIAVAAVINSIQIWWSWFRNLMPTELGRTPVIGHTLIGLGYVLLAFLLLKVGKAINQSQ